MQLHATAIVTLLALIAYFWMATQVARTRRRVGIFGPRMTGDPVLERTIRAHLNTLEWLPIFLPSLWLFALYWGDLPAALIGAAWVVGRLIYFRGYVVAFEKRLQGFLIQASTVSVLLLGALGRAIYVMATQS